MIKITTLIITLNEEKNLQRCLESVVPVSDEIIVLDSFSTDNTVNIARQFGARVIQERFIGYGEQKNLGTSLARNHWILSMDADEVISPELRESLRTLKEEPDAACYQFARLTNYCGKWIRHCGWYPDLQTRLYNREKGQWVERKVHEYWSAANGTAPSFLKGDILHYSFTSVSAHLAKIDKYTSLGAVEALERGKNASLFKLLFSPVWHFFSEFILKKGFLDGYYGYIVCKLSAYSSFLKCAKTRMLFARRQP